MKNRRGEYLYFCSAEQDSLYALTLFREKEKQGTLNVQETGLLLCMEQRAEDSWIYLMPAAVYAAANQKGARSWMNRQKQEKIDLWNEKGIAWMRRYPVFLEQFGWKQRRYAILAAGIFEQLEEESMDEFEKGKNQVCHFLQGSWGFLWKRMQQCDRLSVQEWKEMKAPWKDSVRMDCAMSGILLLMAQLLKKELEERDRLCVGFMKLQQFTQESLRTNGIAAKQSAKVSGAEPVDACGTEIRSVGVDTNPTALVESEKMGWLFQKFRNPERPAYIHEKGRISSEWLEQLHQIMELAGLPAGTFEAVSLSVQEVNGLVNLMGEKLTARQYMTFLMLYSVSRELAQAGRTAAALQFIQTSRLRGAPPAAMGTGMTAAALMSGGAGAMVAERSRYGVRKMSDADGNLVSAEQPALYTQSVPQASQNSY